MSDCTAFGLPGNAVPAASTAAPSSVPRATDTINPGTLAHTDAATVDTSASAAPSGTGWNSAANVQNPAVQTPARTFATSRQCDRCGGRDGRDGLLPRPAHHADQATGYAAGDPLPYVSLELPGPAQGPDPSRGGGPAPSTPTVSGEDGNPGAMEPDFPPPSVLADDMEFVWDDDDAVFANCVRLGERLQQCGDLYRQPGYAGGLLLAPNSNMSTIVDKGSQLAAIIVDRLRVRVIKGGNVKSNRISTTHLNTALQAEVFLQCFRPVDRVTHTPLYLPDWTLTRQGYNDGGAGHRILYLGDSPCAERSLDVIPRFLDVMAFATPADRTNAVAAALTVMLHDHFPGGKPLLAVTANKSHAGKETIIVFAAGSKRMTSISYQSTDWALERAFVGAITKSPDTVIVDVENARLGQRDRCIASAFLERFVTDPEPVLFSTGTGSPMRRANDLVVAVSTNFGALSQDLLNRAMPIHLAPVGDVATRESPIGNPKLEFLPANRERIDAELRGMIERWRLAGMPRDTQVRHPFTAWAAVVGGILQVSGFEHFLANYSVRRTADDPLRRGLGLLGAARSDAWLRSAEWADLACSVGLVKVVIPDADRDSESGRERGIGVVFTAHRDETFSVETEDKRVSLRLEKARRRFTQGEEPETRYRFRVLHQEPIPEDPAGDAA